MTAILLLSAAAGGRQVVYYWTHGPTVSDLRIFRTGVEMVRSGDRARLYHFDAQEKTQVRLYPEVKRAGLLPFNHLAFELILYWPVSRLPYREALIAWAWVNILLVFLIARLMNPRAEGLRHITGIPLAAYMLGFFPLLYVLGEGQDSLIFLFLVVLSWRCSEKGLAVLSGFFLALAMFKFHLVLAIAFFVFLIRRRWRAVGGFVAGGLLVVGISRFIVGPTFARDYLSLLRNQETMTPWGFIPWFMPNLRGLLQWMLARWLDLGMILPIILLASLAVGILTTWILLRSASSKSDASAYSAAILCTLLVSYHLHMQDLSLALFPILLLLDQAARGDLPRKATTSLIVAAAGLYLYRIAAVVAPILLIRGCVLAVPLFLMWLANMSALSVGKSGEQILESASTSVAMY